ncbi:Nucleolar protein 4 [Chelonia mydas]|uniref:Nucleolar protein 4 n=1 Tax=Chelonia mydas TaxID=8469 RepID=M7BFJ8_CHEMY|nr:Nucleolar protein 4 [Chelonia mydas]
MYFLIDDSAAESFNGNETVGHSSNASGGIHCREMAETNSNGKTDLEQDEQPLNLSDSPLSAQLTSEYRLDDHNSNGKNKYKNLLISDLKMEREARENGSKMPEIEELALKLLSDEYLGAILGSENDVASSGKPLN